MDNAITLLSMESLAAVAIGIGLAAATGFRVFLPFLIAGLAARFGNLPLADGFQWLSSTGALVALTTASVIEIAAYYIPIVDHVLDVIAGPAAVAAGVIVSASAMADIPSEIRWPVAIIGGGGIAGVTKLMSALVRAKSGLLTGGLGNPVVSTGETAGALVVAIAAIAIPVISLLGLGVLLFWIGRRARRLAGRGPYIRSSDGAVSQPLPGPGGPGRS
jgi:Domain of unknown function (DUF4126)